MGYLKIHCHYCGGTWEVYKKLLGVEAARACPHCFKSVDGQTWEKQIIPAFHALDDANRELYKDSTGYHVPLFEVDYIADTIFANARQSGTEGVQCGE